MSGLIRKFPSTIIASLVLILFCVYYLIFERGKQEEDGDKQSVFESVDKEDFLSIALIYPDTTILVTKESDSWFLLKNNKKYKADGFAVDSILDSFEGLKIESTISTDTSNLSEYGLDAPSVIVKMKTGLNGYSVEIGNESPIGSGTYALSKGKILLLYKSMLWPFQDRKFNDLRDKEVISLDENKINEVVFTSGKFKQRFKKQGVFWIGDEIPDYIDINHLEIEGIVRSFSDLRVTGFEDDEPESLKKYGLDKPSRILTLVSSGNEVNYLFGNKSEDDNYYLKLDNNQSVFIVSNYNYKQLPQDIDNLRIKKLFDISKEDVVKIGVHRDNGIYSLSRDNSQWKIENVDGDIDQSKVEDLLFELVNLEIREFADDTPSDLTKYGLDGPKVKIYLADKDGSKWGLFIGDNIEDAVYSKKADKNPVYLLDNKILSTIIPLSSEDLILEMSDGDIVKSQ